MYEIFTLLYMCIVILYTYYYYYYMAIESSIKEINANIQLMNDKYQLYYETLTQISQEFEKSIHNLDIENKQHNISIKDTNKKIEIIQNNPNLNNVFIDKRTFDNTMLTINDRIYMLDKCLG